MRGKYRVTLNGFTVQRQTYDHFLQLDGEGDEIYFATYVAVLDTGSADVLQHWVVTSRAMGDREGYPDRVQMGHNSSKGGIRNGDRYPLPTPQRRVGPIARDSLPMLLWEGELVQGQRAVVLAPTVWEWDDNPQLYSYWLVSRGAVMQRFADPEILLSVLDNRAYFPYDLGTPGFRIRTNMFADPRDRPIGLELGRPATGLGFVEPNQGNSNGGKHAASVPGSHRSIVERILATGSTPGGPGGNMFARHVAGMITKFEALLRAALTRPAPISRAKGRVDAITPLPTSADLSRDIKGALRAYVDSAGKTARNGVVRPKPLLGFSRSLASVLRDHLATEVYFFEKTLVLTPQALEAALSQRPKPGIPPGSIDVVYTDHNPLQGRYILHLQVERLP